MTDGPGAWRRVEGAARSADDGEDVAFERRRVRAARWAVALVAGLAVWALVAGL